MTDYPIELADATFKAWEKGKGGFIEADAIVDGRKVFRIQGKAFSTNTIEKDGQEKTIDANVSIAPFVIPDKRYRQAVENKLEQVAIGNAWIA